MTKRRCATMLRWTLPVAVLLAAIVIIAPSARADSPRLTSVTLHEGLNIVGWTGEETSIDDFVRGLPSTPQAVFARDQATGRWRVWGATVPGSLNSLRAIQNGTIVVLRMSAAPPGPWVYPQAASIPPTAIGPELTRGLHDLVWHEPGETHLDDALRGLGGALKRVGRWNALTQRYDILDDGATIRYGDVIRLDIQRAVYWARPTDAIRRRSSGWARCRRNARRRCERRLTQPATGSRTNTASRRRSSRSTTATILTRSCAVTANGKSEHGSTTAPKTSGAATGEPTAPSSSSSTTTWCSEARSGAAATANCRRALAQQYWRILRSRVGRASAL